eukprot:Phypoly_transcript_01444.p1 GENE.Phypoly_transcript_01444~~Phypoly_transcript_01444.p1  ORF type:complete len:1095 (+),score=131.93 Phypoly_transcript_01444:37-3285(+)
MNLKQLLVFILVEIVAGGPLPATNLLLEYLPSPVMGLDVPTPRFSWQVAHTDRGQNQTSYAILVALQSSKQVVWNSGKVPNAQTSQVVYAGQELQSDTSYCWQVTWWDSNGNAAVISQPAYFDTGLFNSSSWVGIWIGGANQLRTEFVLPSDSPIVRARLFISGVGYYVARLNGKRVGDHVLGPWTQFEERILYDVYDVGNLLVAGENAIAIALGNGFYADPSVNVGHIAAICQLSVLFANNTHQWVAVSDLTWKVTNGPVTYDNVYVGENYDARRATLGWDKAGFNDSLWNKSSTADPTPPGKLQGYLAYPQKKVETYSPVKYWEPAPGVFVFDFGQNMAGWSQIRAIGPSGTTITIQHSEMVSPVTGELEFMYPNAPMVDKFTLAGTGEWEYFEPEFVFHGFQYVQISGYPGVPAAESIQAHFIHSAFPETGNFMCANNVINTIDHMTRVSAISNFQSIPSDCPTREKRGWLGDAQVSGEVQMQYWDMGAAYTKFVQDIHDSQTKIGNGNLGDTAPWYNWGATPADPAWGTAFTLLWYWSYVYYNDTRMLTTHYDAVKWYVSTLTAQSNNITGLLEWSRYGDWCSVANMAQYPAVDSPVISSFYYILQLEVMVNISTMLGQSDDSQYFSKLLTNARTQFNPTYYNTNNYTYNWGYQTLQILPMVLNLVEVSQVEEVEKYLLNDILNEHAGHLTVGIVGAKYLLSTLTNIGRADVAWTVTTQTDYPSWYNFAVQGGTSLWENWQSTREVAYGSRNHIMFGGQATWYYQALAGITMTPGTIAYKDITIEPLIIYEPELAYAQASINTYSGQISSSWFRDPGLCVSAAENTNATLECPNGVISNITFASFGLPTGTCGNFTMNPSCNANDTVGIVSKLCVGKTLCEVPATDTLFGDPCEGQVKHLNIQAAGCFFPYNLDISIPFNSMANVVVSKFSLSNSTILEGGTVIWENGQYRPGLVGILQATNRGDAVVFRVGGGSYNFMVGGIQGTTTSVSLTEGDTFEASCPAGTVVARIKQAQFGFLHSKEKRCSLGSTKHVLEKKCLYRNSCVFALTASLFGDKHHSVCGEDKYVMEAEFVCAAP